MGQDASTPIGEDVPPRSLDNRTLDSIARYIRDGRAKKIVVMVGAGISTSAGIPDFRTKRTGLYDNLDYLDLPRPECLFELEYFKQNPQPFYTFAHRLYPGNYLPTVAHLFLRVLSDKGLLLKLFTQNIDCLDQQAGIPSSQIIEAHGSFADQHCIECKRAYPADDMDDAVRASKVARCKCNGLVKPDIVFFGESLPTRFIENRALPCEADLCIVLGTSLSVQPFASLPDQCVPGTPRLLINLEPAGSLGCRPDDVVLLEECDSGVRKLAQALDWTSHLEKLWNSTDRDGRQFSEISTNDPFARIDDVEARVNELTKEVDQALLISNNHVDVLRRDLEGGLNESQDSKPNKNELMGKCNDL